MKYIDVKGKKNKETININVSRILMGSGDFLKVENLEEAGVILDQFIEVGGTTFDTARHYRHSEKALGAWMDERNNRDQVVILTKCCHPVREAPDTPRVKPEYILSDLEESLGLLGTDYVDLLALHRDDLSQPVGPLMEMLHQLVEAGKVYAIGASNWTITRIEEANAYAREHGLTEFTFISPHLSLAKPLKEIWPDTVTADDAMQAWCLENDVPLIAWSAQAGGFFTGRFTPDYLEDQNMVDVFYSDENWGRFDRAKEMAAQKGVSTIQIALAYVVNQRFSTGAVIGPSNLSELLSSYAGAQIELTEQEINWLKGGVAHEG